MPVTCVVLMITLLIIRIIRKYFSLQVSYEQGLKKPIQKCTGALCQLAYGALTDHYVRIGETIAFNCLHNFCKCIIEIFKDTYLRSPTSEDIQRLLHLHSQRHDFPGMLGSIDCMHWHWRNCPVAWKSQFTRGDQGVNYVGGCSFSGLVDLASLL